jgi:hypothetical protein
VRADYLVRNRSAGHRDRDHAATRSIDGLANGFGHFVGLAGGKADATLTIADGDKSVEGEAASALHDLRDTIDRDDVLD